MIQPEIVVWYWHLVKGNLFCVFEETVRSPDVMQPVHVEYSVLFRHILRQPQSRVPPTLREKYVGHVRLLPRKNNVWTQMLRFIYAIIIISRWHNHVSPSKKLCLNFTSYMSAINVEPIENLKSDSRGKVTLT